MRLPSRLPFECDPIPAPHWHEIPPFELQSDQPAPAGLPQCVPGPFVFVLGEETYYDNISVYA